MSSKEQRRRLGARAWYLTPAVMVPILAVSALAAGSAYAFVRPQPGSATVTFSVVGGFVVTTEFTPTTGKVLGPGGKGDLSIKFAQAAQPYKITAISQDPLRTVTVTGGGSGCTGSSVSLATITGLDVSVTTSAVTKRYRNAVSMRNDAPNGCQGASFTIPVVLTGRSL